MIQNFLFVIEKSYSETDATFAGAAAFLLILAGMSVILLWESEDNSILTVDGEIAWICGLRISEWVKITKNTKEKALLKYNYL